jgi:hypothetical protein
VEKSFPRSADLESPEYVCEVYRMCGGKVRYRRLKHALCAFNRMQKLVGARPEGGVYHCGVCSDYHITKRLRFY